MTMVEQHPELARAVAWAHAHPELLAEAWNAFDADGEWPEIERLQQAFEREGLDLDVAVAAWQIPNALGFLEQERLVLRVRGLSFVPGAGELLEDWAAALKLAYARYLDEEEPMLRRADLTNDLGLDPERVDRVSRLLLRESWAFGSGHGGPADDWEFEIRSGVRAARAASSAAELLANRDAIEFPTPAADSPTGNEAAADELVAGPPSSTRAPGIDPPLMVRKVEEPDRRRKVMVVYGRDTPVASALFGWLRAVDLRPQEWTELVSATASGSPYTGEVLDRAMEIVQAVVVLFTPDDLVRLRDDLLQPDDGPEARTLRGQPRPNVLYEAGLAFGRHRDQTILVEHGELRGLSDLTGRHAVRLSRGVTALHDLAQRLQNAGCKVNTSGEDWLDASRFPNPPDLSAYTSAGMSSSGGNAPEPPSADSRPDRLERLLVEILEAALDGPVAGDVVAEIAKRLRSLEGPTRGDELFEGLPGRQLPTRALKRVMWELEQHHVLRRNPDASVRGYVLGEPP